MIKLNLKEIISIMQLIEGPMHGEMARQRNKIVNILEEDYHSYFDRRVAILESFSDKDENGKVKVEKGTYEMPEEKAEEAKKAISTFMEEEKEYDLPNLKKLLDNPDKKMTIADGKTYDEIMTKLENK